MIRICDEGGSIQAITCLYYPIQYYSGFFSISEMYRTIFLHPGGNEFVADILATLKF